MYMYKDWLHFVSLTSWQLIKALLTKYHSLNKTKICHWIRQNVCCNRSLLCHDTYIAALLAHVASFLGLKTKEKSYLVLSIWLLNFLASIAAFCCCTVIFQVSSVKCNSISVSKNVIFLFLFEVSIHSNDLISVAYFILLWLYYVRNV